MGTKSGAGRRNQDILGTGVEPRTLCVEEKQIRPMQIAATHIRMPHRNGTGRRKGGHIHGIQRQRAAQNTERRIQLHSDNGNTGAPVLRILRLPREQFLRTVEPFRNTRRTKVAHRHGTRDGNCCDNGHRAQPRRENETEGLGNLAGDPCQYFYGGDRREHPAWDSLCFDYGKTTWCTFCSATANTGCRNSDSTDSGSTE